MAIKLDRYFYILEKDENGELLIHLQGKVFLNGDNEYGLAEWTFEYISVPIAQRWWEALVWTARTANTVKYWSKMTEAKALDTCKTYFDGQAGNELNLMDITLDTPEGCYYFDM